MVQEYHLAVRSYTVIDGDSVRVILDCAFRIRYETVARLWGVDTPKKSTLSGGLVTSVVEKWLETRDDGLIFHSMQEDKYGGRWDGDLYHSNNPGATLSNYLYTSGLAKAYDGGKKEEWGADDLLDVERKAKELLR